MALSIALVGIKGGVGKTTTAVNLAGLAALGGLRTLVWDLDPQGAASFALGFDKKGKGATHHLTRKRPDLDDAIFRTSTPGLDLVPADISLRALDFALAERSRSRRRVGEALASIDTDYDAVFIDCPPGVTLANDGTLRAAQVYLSPIVPSALAVRAFDQLATYVADQPKATGQLLGFLSMVDRRKRVHRELALQLPRTHANVLASAVPASAAVENAPQFGTPYVRGRRGGRAAIAYRDLWNEVQTRVFGRQIDLTTDDAGTTPTAGGPAGRPHRAAKSRRH